MFTGFGAVQELEANVHHVHQERQAGVNISTQHRLKVDTSVSRGLTLVSNNLQTSELRVLQIQ